MSKGSGTEGRVGTGDGDGDRRPGSGTGRRSPYTVPRSPMRMRDLVRRTLYAVRCSSMPASIQPSATSMEGGKMPAQYGTPPRLCLIIPVRRRGACATFLQLRPDPCWGSRRMRLLRSSIESELLAMTVRRACRTRYRTAQVKRVNKERAGLVPTKTGWFPWRTRFVASAYVA